MNTQEVEEEEEKEEVKYKKDYKAVEEEEEKILLTQDYPVIIPVDLLTIYFPKTYLYFNGEIDQEDVNSIDRIVI